MTKSAGRSTAVWTVPLLLTASTIASAQQWISVANYPIPTPNSLPGGITAGPDGALWFTVSNTGKIGRVTTEGAITEFPIPTANGEPGGIIAGPDGALWFTEYNGNKIGRITTTGLFTEYPVPTRDSSPDEIAAGPDGALWFTEYNGNKIGRISTAGVISEYVIPRQRSYPEGIAPGLDGALWFAEGNVMAIGRITVNGAFTEYPVEYYTNAITRGPDGALWFSAGGVIGRITTAGALTYYPTNYADFVGSMTSGPDGAVWFTEPQSCFDAGCGGVIISRVTMAGVMTEYRFASDIYSHSPVGVATGADRALWFTDYFGGSIARAPACGLGLTLSFVDTTLNLGFDLGIPTPATWNGYISDINGLRQLWSKPISAISPVTSFTFNDGPGFSPEGEVGIASVLTTPSGEALCAESRIVDTGGTGAAVKELRRSMDPKALAGQRR